MDIKVKVEGLKELEKALAELKEEYGGKSAQQAMRPAVRKALKPAESTIKSTTPVDSGALAESTKIRIGKPSKAMLKSEHFNEQQVIAGRVGWTWKSPSLWSEALAVEFGTQNRPADQTLRNAFDNHSDQMIETFKNELGPSIERKAKALHKKRSKG